jgi:hypothetical protein
MPIVVNNFSLQLNYILDKKQNTLCKFIHMEVSINNGFFPFRALEEFVEVRNGTVIERPFQLRISPNQKAMISFFAIDAFTNFLGYVDVWFGYAGGELNIFNNVDINNIIEPLPLNLAHINVTDATKSWLGI